MSMFGTYYEIFIQDESGQFVRAPNPPPPEWRERKGVCRRCGEKVFVKAGPKRSFWTHGKGKTCVPKPNSVDDSITAVEQYEHNRGALSAGDDKLKSDFEEQIGSQAKAADVGAPVAQTIRPPAIVTIYRASVSDANRSFTRPAEELSRKQSAVSRKSDDPCPHFRPDAVNTGSKAGWAPGEKEWWQKHLAAKRMAWKRGR